MKKLYIAPEMEIKKFSVEDIMTSSSLAPVYGQGAVADADTGVVESVDYNQLFNIQ